MRHRAALLCALALTATARAISTAVENCAWPVLVERLALRLRLEALQTLLWMPVERLDALPPGVAASRLVSDPRDVALGATAIAAALGRDGLAVAVLAVLAAWLHPGLFLVTAVVWPGVAVGLAVSARRQRGGAEGSLVQRDTLATWAALLPSAASTVIVAGATAWTRQAAANAAIHHARAETRRAILSAVTSPATELAGGLGVVLALSVLGHLGPSQADRTIAFFYVVFMAYRPLKSLGTLQVATSTAIHALGRLTSLAFGIAPPRPAVRASTLLAPPLSVWRGTHKVVLQDGLSLRPGELVAITGTSGAGKTTLLEALALLRPASRPIGLDLTTSDQNSLHAGFAPQHPPILPVSVAENLVLGLNRPANLGQVLAAVGLDDWVASMPAGLDTLLGPGGVVPSAGERQRLGVARALLTHANVVLLDEPTAGLDGPMAARVGAALRQAADAGRGVLAVTHDRALVAVADRVIAL